VEQYRYGDFGKPQFFNGAGSNIAASAVGNTTLFTGRRYDPTTGLYDYRTRKHRRRHHPYRCDRHPQYLTVRGLESVH
jgi:hypothetical protein